MLPACSNLWDDFYPVFREENPGIEIEFMPSAGGDIRENAVTQMVAGDAPDLIEFCCQNSTYFVQIGETMNLQPCIDRDADEVNIDDYYAHQFDPWLEGRRHPPHATLHRHPAHLLQQGHV